MATNCLTHTLFRRSVFATKKPLMEASICLILVSSKPGHRILQRSRYPSQIQAPESFYGMFIIKARYIHVKTWLMYVSFVLLKEFNDKLLPRWGLDINMSTYLVVEYEPGVLFSGTWQEINNCHCGEMMCLSVRCYVAER